MSELHKLTTLHVCIPLLQAFCSSIVGVLAAQAMLKAYGVGDEKATVLAATFTWLLKGIYIDLFQLQDNFSPYRTNFK